MSFGSYEESDEDGRPVELYEFYYLGQVSRWTSWDRDITVGLLTYTQAILNRGNIEETGMSTSNPNLTITCEPNFPIAELFEVCPPSDVVNIVIKRVQLEDLTDVAVIYSGRILNVAWPADAAKLTCQSLFTRLKQPGLRRCYGKLCPHLLYKTGEGECNAVEANFKETVVIGGADGITVQCGDFAAKPDGYFAGGKLTVEMTPGVFEKRGIRTHVGDTITMTHMIPGLEGLMTVDVLPGCDHTRTTCRDKFNNEPNYGGTPFIPQKNPFGQSSVF
jgi:uncharacterized phage protein (TIGR02218 family)